MKSKITKLFLFLSFLFAQTDQEVKQIKNVISQTGMSKEQAIKAAKSKGFSTKQINEAVQKVEEAISSDKKLSSKTIQNIKIPKIEVSNKIDFEKSQSGINETLLQEVIPKSSISTLQYFGYDIFKKNPALFQGSNTGLVDPNYIIGPGDEIIVMLWGETQFRQVLKVDREGFFFIPEIGQVFVNGLNLSLLESKLFRVFSKSYASLNPIDRDPTTFLDVSLGILRPLRIQVLGEVGQPGAYTVSPSTTLYSSLYYFNGPTALGSLRDIHLIRGGQKIGSIDFYNYLLTGKKIEDQKLQLDDIVFIPRRLKTVTIKGQIKRDGIYELKEKESLLDLISIAGDLKITAYLDRAQVDRIVPFKQRNEQKNNRVYLDVDLNEVLSTKNSFQLQDGDIIEIFSIFNTRTNAVTIEGAVTRPGVYDIGEALKLSELIKKADGVLGDAFLEKVDIIRVKPDLTEELIELNLEQVINENLESDIDLKGQDRVKVYGILGMRPNKYVSITGNVKKPGRFILHENMTLYDLIFNNGGFMDEKFKESTFLERADLIRLNNDGYSKKIIPFNLGNILKKDNKTPNLVLLPEDQIKIYSGKLFYSVKQVTIAGAVRIPGTFDLKKEMEIKDLIIEAGGLNENTQRIKVEIARVNPYNDDLTKYAEIISIDLDGDFMFEDKKSRKKIVLKPCDIVYIRDDPYFKTQRKKRLLI